VFNLLNNLSLFFSTLSHDFKRFFFLFFLIVIDYFIFLVLY
jgi:hypothetical protein